MTILVVAVPEGLPLAVTISLAFSMKVWRIMMLTYEWKQARRRPCCRAFLIHLSLSAENDAGQQLCARALGLRDDGQRNSNLLGQDWHAYRKPHDGCGGLVRWSEILLSTHSIAAASCCSQRDLVELRPELEGTCSGPWTPRSTPVLCTVAGTNGLLMRTLVRQAFLIEHDKDTIEFVGNRTECALLMLQRKWLISYKDVRNMNAERIVQVSNT